MRSRLKSQIILLEILTAAKGLDNQMFNHIIKIRQRMLIRQLIIQYICPNFCQTFKSMSLTQMTIYNRAMKKKKRFYQRRQLMMKKSSDSYNSQFISLALTKIHWMWIIFPKSTCRNESRLDQLKLRRQQDKGYSVDWREFCQIQFGSDIDNVDLSGLNLNGYLLLNCKWKGIKIHELNQLDVHSCTVSSICFFPDGTTIASGSDDNSIRL